jgi:hypothetical protein
VEYLDLLVNVFEDLEQVDLGNLAFCRTQNCIFLVVFNSVGLLYFLEQKTLFPSQKCCLNMCLCMSYSLEGVFPSKFWMCLRVWKVWQM